MRPYLTQEDFDAFIEFRSEVLRSRVEAVAAEQASQGGLPLTEMSFPEINDWLRNFHGEIRQHLQNLSDSEKNAM